MLLALTSRGFHAGRCLSRTTSVRFLSQSTGAKPPLFQQHYRLSRVGLATGSVLAVSAWLVYPRGSQSIIHADAPEESRPNRSPTPFSSLIRSYVVYSFCSIPTIIDWSPTILSTLFAIPGLRQITEAFVRVTFFDHVSYHFSIFLSHQC